MLLFHLLIFTYRLYNGNIIIEDIFGDIKIRSRMDGTHSEFHVHLNRNNFANSQHVFKLIFQKPFFLV